MDWELELNNKGNKSRSELSTGTNFPLLPELQRACDLLPPTLRPGPSLAQQMCTFKDIQPNTSFHVQTAFVGHFLS